MMKLRPGRKLCEFGGFGINRQLFVAHNEPDVFWSQAGNSYVVAELRESVQPGYVLVSINGIGEIRWSWTIPLPPWVEGEAYEAMDYFFEEISNNASKVATT